MSWGYFLDFNLTLPSTEFAKLKRERANDHPIKPGWWGFKDQKFDAAFCGDPTGPTTFGKVLGWYEEAKDAVLTVSPKGKTTAIRCCCVLDKSELYMASYFASFLEAARGRGEGSVVLVNDGTSGGEDGVTVTLSKGELSRSRIDDFLPYMDQLGPLLFGAPAQKKPKKKRSV